MEKSLKNQPGVPFSTHFFPLHIPILSQRLEKPLSLPIKNSNCMRRVDGFHKGFFFFVAPFYSSLSLSFIPSTPFLSRSTLDWCVQVLLLSSLDPTQAPGTAAQLFSPRFFLCWELAQLQKSSPPALESCILYSIPTEQHALQRCLCYFCKSFQQHLCSQVSPLGFFRCLLIINSCSSPLLPQIHSQLFLCCQLQPLHFIWSIKCGFPFWNCVLLVHRGLSWNFCLPAPETAQIPLLLHWRF